MKKTKTQWTPKIVNLRKEIVDGEEKWVEFDTKGYVIPAGHCYYDIIKGFYEQDQREGA